MVVTDAKEFKTLASDGQLLDSRSPLVVVVAPYRQAPTIIEEIGFSTYPNGGGARRHG